MKGGGGGGGSMLRLEFMIDTHKFEKENVAIERWSD